MMPSPCPRRSTAILNLNRKQMRLMVDSQGFVKEDAFFEFCPQLVDGDESLQEVVEKIVKHKFVKTMNYLSKEAIPGKRYDNDEQVLGDVRMWLRERPVEWYRAGIHALTKRWRKAIDLNGDYVEKR
ncbi:hypothetical protein C0J52_04656 [Blattella germanica]|nr:hypothetical protein C0J52_04656 [Blattella germanica]